MQDPELAPETDQARALLGCLSDLNVASKEWIVRQYDHEVQAASAGKPLVGRLEDGPADATVLATGDWDLTVASASLDRAGRKEWLLRCDVNALSALAPVVR